MPNEVLTQFGEWLHRYFPSMALAAFGTIIQALNRHHDEWSWKCLAIGIATAFFVGLVMSCLLEPMSVSPASKAAAIAISGYLANDVLRVVSERILNKIDVFKG